MVEQCSFYLHHISAIILMLDYSTVGAIFSMHPRLSPNSCKNMPCSQRVKHSSGVPHYELKKHKQYFILLSIRGKKLC